MKTPRAALFNTYLTSLYKELKNKLYTKMKNVFVILWMPWQQDCLNVPKLYIKMFGIRFQGKKNHQIW